MKTEKELIQAAQAGSTKAFEELTAPLLGRLRGLIYGITRDHTDTDDVLNEALAKAWQKLHYFHQKSSFYTWLYVITQRHCINYINKRKNNISLDDPDAGVETHFDYLEATRVIGTDELVARSEVAARLHAEIAKLSPNHQYAVKEFYLNGRPAEELATESGVPAETIRTRLHYAKRALRQGIERNTLQPV